jgi:putative ABC transport system substrate-binding protein
MNRRGAVATLIALAIAPSTSTAQAVRKTRRIGFLSLQSGPHEVVSEFRAELRRLGYAEGDLAIEYGWAAGKPERLPELAAEMVRKKVDVIVAQATAPVSEAKRATSSIPIVMTGVAVDPVEFGLVGSLAHPGGNVTGMSLLSNELAAKRLQLLREIIPKATRVAVLVFRGYSTTPLYLKQIRLAAQQLNIALVVQELSAASELDEAFAAMGREHTNALIVQLNPFTSDYRNRITDLTLKHRVPAMFDSSYAVSRGALLSYGPSLADAHRRAARYVDQILKGARPADLPVEQPTKLELIINLKTARIFGLLIPQSVLQRADEVIR